MYEDFFALKEKPFGVNPDPRFLFSTDETEEALACLTYGVIDRRGFIQLTGEVGTGKTTILNLFLDWLSESNVPTAFVFNPRLGVEEFFDYVLADFGIACESPSKGQKLTRLNDWLLEGYRMKKTAVLVIDEAQDLSTELLEETRLLTNLETHTEKLIQIVLSGQPELEEKLRQPELRQLRQRITLRCQTRALTLEETIRYISSRLSIAGRKGDSPFSPSAIVEIYKHSRGIPRLINLLCDHALIASYAEGRLMVTGRCVEGIASEFDFQSSEVLKGRLSDNGHKGTQIAKRTEDKPAIEGQLRPLEGEDS
jgi:general secretion pathway protein A